MNCFMVCKKNNFLHPFIYLTTFEVILDMLPARWSTWFSWMFSLGYLNLLLNYFILLQLLFYPFFYLFFTKILNCFLTHISFFQFLDYFAFVFSTTISLIFNRFFTHYLSIFSIAFLTSLSSHFFISYLTNFFRTQDLPREIVFYYKGNPKMLLEIIFLIKLFFQGVCP